MTTRVTSSERLTELSVAENQGTNSTRYDVAGIIGVLLSILLVPPQIPDEKPEELRHTETRDDGYASC